MLQAEQLGNRSRNAAGRALLSDDEDILMLYGDVPLISVETLQRLRDAKPQAWHKLLTVAGRSERLPYYA